MGIVKVTDNIFWVGAVDWNVKSFHGHTYTTKRGTTYNAYLIVDEKIALVDTVYGPFTNEMIEKIEEVIGSVSRIDYVISNHVETDHSGGMPGLMARIPKVPVYCTQKGKEGLYKNYYGNWDYKIVKSGDELKLGKNTCVFLEAPMIHWPDSMFTYVKEQQVLLPNDAFGQHIATSERFDDEVDMHFVMEEATKYYANILWPLNSLISKKLDEVIKMNIGIKIIGPSHGIIWRKDPGKIVKFYSDCSNSRVTVDNKVVIAYETMWNSTELIAKSIAEGLISEGMSVKLYNIPVSDMTEVIAECFTAKGILFGSSTHDNEMLPNIAMFIHMLKGLRPKGKYAGCFGSMGWAGGAVKDMQETLAKSGLEFVIEPVSCKFVPDKEETKKCIEFGKSFAKILKSK